MPMLMDSSFHRFRDNLERSLVRAVNGNILPALLVKEIEGVQMLIIRGAYDSEENHMQFRHVNMTAEMFTESLV